MRPLNQIAAEILVLWRGVPPTASYKMFSTPYVEAMLDLKTCRDTYGTDHADGIVLYALSNMSSWRGPDAKRIKDELQQHLKAHNAHYQGK